MAQLTMRRGPQAGKIFELTADVITIGRGAKNDIIIDNDDVSRDHCRLVRVTADYELHDLNSANGTFIDGQRVSKNRVLPSTSLIELGDSITFEYERGTLPSTASLKKDTAAPDPSTDDYFLVVKMGREGERVYTLQTDSVRIGRDLSNDIVIQDPEVSRWHFELKRDGDGYMLRDLGSTNGTLVNGNRITDSLPLQLNDHIELGSSTRLYFVQTLEDLPGGVTAASTVTFSVDLEATKTDTREAGPDNVIDISRKPATSRLGTGLHHGALENHVFIAYAREDWEQIVAPLTLALQDAGMGVWVDQYLVQGGNDWQAAIEQALRECWLLVVVLSPEAVESRYCRLEYRYFINREKPIIPFVYKPLDKLPPELSGLEVIRYDKDNSKRSFQRVIFEILHKRT
jgi:pSer/pThr/pTyr-binding forkhead associated (FHA) protein